MFDSTLLHNEIEYKNNHISANYCGCQLSYDHLILADGDCCPGKRKHVKPNIIKSLCAQRLSGLYSSVCSGLEASLGLHTPAIVKGYRLQNANTAIIRITLTFYNVYNQGKIAELNIHYMKQASCLRALLRRTTLSRRMSGTNMRRDYVLRKIIHSLENVRARFGLNAVRLIYAFE